MFIYTGKLMPVRPAVQSGSSLLFSTFSRGSVLLQASQRDGPHAFSDVIKKQEDHNEVPKESVSGAPQALVTERMVRIYKESKSATQSGSWNRHNWKLDWDILGKGNRWENDLIGYQSSGDYMQGTIMKFDTREAAVRFAQGQGWSYYVQEPKERRFKKKDYSANFYHIPGKLKRIITK